MLGVLNIWSEHASGGVMMLLTALGVAVLLSTLRVLFSRISRASRQREKSFLEHLDFMAPRTNSSAKPSSGVDNLKPLPQDRSSIRASRRAHPRL